MYKLVLSKKGFPNRFDSHNNLPNYDTSLTTRENAEKVVIDSFNNYNPKLNITKIEYEDLEDLYSEYIYEYKSSGIIVKELNVPVTLDNQDFYLNDGYVIVNHNKFEKVHAYVYISSEEENSRNIFVAQTIFPSLIEQMKLYLDGPSYTITNKPVYFVNIVNKDYSILTNSIPRHINFIQNAGIHIIDITQNIGYEFNTDLEKIFSRYLSEYYDAATKTYNYLYNYHECYSLDVRNKILTLKKETIEAAIEQNNSGRYVFKGSNEKFYWIETIPLVMIAKRQNYTVDITEYEEFINRYSSQLGTQKKFIRCQWILEYFQKIISKDDS